MFSAESLLNFEAPAVIRRSFASHPFFVSLNFSSVQVELASKFLPLYHRVHEKFGQLPIFFAIPQSASAV